LEMGFPQDRLHRPGHPSPNFFRGEPSAGERCRETVSPAFRAGRNRETWGMMRCGDPHAGIPKDRGRPVKHDLA
jgi:hypothetical protein